MLPGTVFMGIIKKYILIATGLVSLSLGILGIFLPLLPTTPFLLLASYCFIRSSKRLHLWLINHRIFGEYINNYLVNKAITLRMKIYTLIVLWASLIISIIAVGKLYISILLPVIGIGVSIHILSLTTYNSKKNNKN